jgi:L-rhamnose mutarotase
MTELGSGDRGRARNVDWKTVGDDDEKMRKIKTVIKTEKWQRYCSTCQKKHNRMDRGK